LLAFAHTVYVGPGRAHTGLDFANRRTSTGGSISGTIFVDRNGNGVRDASEPAQSGWRVYLDVNRNQRFDAGERSVVTGSNGAYAFADLAAGTYAVREVDQPGWTRPRGSPVVRLAAGATMADTNIGNVHVPSAVVNRLASIGGQPMTGKSVASLTANVTRPLVSGLRPTGVAALSGA
jgi:hypothetical protein